MASGKTASVRHNKGTYTETSPVFGFITTDGTQCEIYILVRHPLEDGGVTIDSITYAGFRIPSGGYVPDISTSLIQHNYDVYNYNSCIRIVFTNSNGFGLTNNTPITGTIEFTYTLY